MDTNDLMDEEEATLKAARAIIGEERNKDNPLYQSFKSLYRLLTKTIDSEGQQPVSTVVKTMVENVPAGIALIDDTGCIVPPCSGYLFTLYDKHTISNGTIADVLYWEEWREKERETLIQWLDIAFNLSHDWDLVEELGPDIIEHKGDTGTSRHKISCRRIIDDGVVRFLLVCIVEDKTGAANESETTQRDTAHTAEMEIISSLIHQEDPAETAEFIAETRTLLSNCSTLVDELDFQGNTREGYNAIFRLMHSIKGLSKAYGMNALAKLAHQAEDALDSFGIEESPPTITIRNILGDMERLLNGGETILRKFYKSDNESAAMVRSQRRGVRVELGYVDKVTDLFKSLESAVENNDSSVPEKLALLKEGISRLSLQPLDVAYNRFRRIVNDMATSLNKKAELVITGETVLLPPETHHIIIASLIHLLRNAMDHGIEAPETRERSGKPEKGEILISTSVSDGRVTVFFSDDGAGIDPEAVALKAVKDGFITLEAMTPLSAEEKTDLILLPGFSIKGTSSDISGRGVGMDVVASALKQLGGSLEIQSELNTGVSFSLSFPVRTEGVPIQ